LKDVRLLVKPDFVLFESMIMHCLRACIIFIPDNR
jgi:hypothetical protein